MSTRMDGTKGILQMLAGGSVYTPSWHISLGINGGDLWTASYTTWEITGSRVPLTTGWEADPAWTNQNYQDGVRSTATVDVPCPIAASIRYYAIWDGAAATRWMWMGQFQNYPLVTEAGDYVRFLAGSLKIVIDY